MRLFRKLKALAGDAPLLRNVLVLMAGSGGAAALLIFAAPFLTRLYHPDAFGAFAVYASTISILLTVSSLRYEIAVPLPEEDAVAANVLALALLILAAASLSLSVAVWFFGAAFAGWTHSPALRPYLFVLPVALFGGGAYQALGYWAIRKEQFNAMARTRLEQSALTVAPQLVLGIWQIGPVGLLAGDGLGRYAGLASLVRVALRTCPYRAISWKGIGEALRRYRNFPLMNSPAAILTAVSTQIPTVLLAHYAGPAVAAFYALTTRVLQAPASLVGQAIGQTFLARAASVRVAGALSALTQKTAIFLFVIGLPIFGFIMINGSDLFAAAFGERWRESGVYAAFLAPWYLLWLIANPLSNLLTVREWQGTTLKYALLECVVKVGAVVAGVQQSGRFAVQLLGVSAATLALLTMSRFFQAAYTNLRSVAPQATLTALIGAASAAPGLLVPATSGLWGMGLRLAVSGSIYSALIWRFRCIAR